MFYPCVIGYGQILVIVLVVLLLFGGRKLPELMRGMGRGVKEFKDAVNGDAPADEQERTSKDEK